MENVKYLFFLDMDWNKSYSDTTLPKSYNKPLLDYQKKLIEEVDDKIPNTKIENIVIKNVESHYTSMYNSISRVFQIKGYSDSHIKNMKFYNMDISAFEYGNIENVDDISFENTDIRVIRENDSKNDEYDNR